MVFLNQTFANAPRAFLLALVHLALPHALPSLTGAPTVLQRSQCQRASISSPQSGRRTPAATGASSSSSSSSISTSTNATSSTPRRARTGSGTEEAKKVRTWSSFQAVGYDSSHVGNAFSAWPHATVSPQAANSGDNLDDTEIAAGSSNSGLGVPARAAALR